MKRLNLSATAAFESKTLNFLIKFLPLWIQPDHLTLIALASALISGIFYVYAGTFPVLLLLINIMLVIHWFADSLDGRLARVRNESRPRYGYYIDHIFDSVSAAFFLGGITSSDLTLTTSWNWILVMMFLCMIHVFLKTKVYSIFELSIQNLGPTEARLGLIFVNFLVFISGNPRFHYLIDFTFLDLLGGIILIGFIIVLVPEILNTCLKLSREDVNKRLKH